MNTDKIKSLIEEVLKKMTISFDEIEISFEADNKPRFLIKTKDSHLLIGHRGENFTALNHLIKRIVSKEAPEDFKFSIDINNYQQSNLEMIKKKAKVIADRVKSFKMNMEMEPMSSYERMTVHAMFTDDKNIKTESVGEGKDRRVVIKFVENEF